jgi:tetratricopeptide (TPR) repeat protein
MITSEVIKYSSGKIDESIKNLEKILTSNPKSSTAFFHLGQAHIRKKDFNNALRCFNRAIELKPDYSEAINARGLIYASQNEIQLALKDIKSALQLNPISHKYYESLIQINNINRSVTNNFIDYWSKTLTRKIICGSLLISVILSIFYAYYYMPTISTLAESDVNGIKSFTRIEKDSKIPSYGFLIIVGGILFSPLLRRAKIGLNQIEMEFVEQTVVGSQDISRNLF